MCSRRISLVVRSQGSFVVYLQHFVWICVLGLDIPRSPKKMQIVRSSPVKTQTKQLAQSHHHQSSQIKTPKNKASQVKKKLRFSLLRHHIFTAVVNGPAAYVKKGLKKY
jgi:cytochrome c biogenesis protein ResB